jgi:hypothetical protein
VSALCLQTLYGGKAVSDAIPDPIPRDLREAFDKAVTCYVNIWSPSDAAPETEVLFNAKLYPFSAIFRFAENFSDPMPDHLQRHLARLPGGGDLGNLSYGSGARYLLKLMRDRKDTSPRFGLL